MPTDRCSTLRGSCGRGCCLCRGLVRSSGLVRGLHEPEDITDAGLVVGIISDTSLATGRHLRTYLDRHDILRHVTSAAFSDEVGVYKPDPAIFEAAMAGLDIDDPSTVVHVGDLRRTDVAGARALGMATVRFRGVLDDDGPGDEADHVIGRLADLPGLLGLG